MGKKSFKTIQKELGVDTQNNTFIRISLHHSGEKFQHNYGSSGWHPGWLKELLKTVEELKHSIECEMHSTEQPVKIYSSPSLPPKIIK